VPAGVSGLHRLRCSGLPAHNSAFAEQYAGPSTWVLSLLPSNSWQPLVLASAIALAQTPLHSCLGRQLRCGSEYACSRQAALTPLMVLGFRQQGTRDYAVGEGPPPSVLAAAQQLGVQLAVQPCGARVLDVARDIISPAHGADLVRWDVLPQPSVGFQCSLRT
jgi:hypothetical protein